MPRESEGYRHSWYLYTVRLKNANANRRDAFVNELRKRGIGAAVYYHTPIHMMSFYRRVGAYKLPETELAAQQVLSLPVHPGVSEEQIDFIAETVIQTLKKPR